MNSFNRVILLGNLTEDPKLHKANNGRAVVRLGLAVNRAWQSEGGESKSDVTFVDIDAYGRQAETLSKYLRKGSLLLVEGRLRLHTWKAKVTGTKQSKLRVDLERFTFVGGSRKQRMATTGRATPEASMSPEATESSSSECTP
jgi:single-strand DNA-binding protein